MCPCSFAYFAFSPICSSRNKKVVKDEKLAENAEILGNRFREALHSFQSPMVTNIRGLGLLNGITIADPKTKGSKGKQSQAQKLCLKLKENGLLAKPTHGDKIRFAPPLTITTKELDICLNIIETSLEQVTRSEEE